ncbi:MAG: hypothetical protein KKA81_04710 [Bacteroidetes bacterium]|nr:hypothetical protein [Bacteroidota bacterium]
MTQRIAISCIIFLSISAHLSAQIDRYWSQNFNDESSMLAGAVVGGDAGVASIYYNPANISEITESRLSVSVSLFSLSMYNLKNAVGDDLDLNKTKFMAQPRFISYLLDFKRFPKVSMELAFMNVANNQVRFSYTEDEHMDILTELPGEERYYASYVQENNYRDDYFGAGFSYQFSDRFWVGTSALVSVKSVRSLRDLDIEAIPLTDSVGPPGSQVPAYDASYAEYDEIRFDNFSLVWKFGAAYRFRFIRLGMNISLPSANLFTGGKYASRLIKQNNITSPDGITFLPDYSFAGTMSRKELKVRYRTPFSLAIGATFNSPTQPDKSFFLTAEYFAALPVYEMLHGDGYPAPMPEGVIGVDSASWMTYKAAARDLINLATGYRWIISPKVLLLAGFKTDFNFLKGVVIDGNRTDNYSINVYHLTSGFRIKIKQNVILWGIQYSFGYDKGKKQLMNLSNPVEYNQSEQKPLQGTRENNMNVLYNGLSFFLGATFNFGGKAD